MMNEKIIFSDLDSDSEKQHVLFLIFNRRENQFNQIVKSLLRWNSDFFTKTFLIGEIDRAIDYTVKEYCKQSGFEGYFGKKRMKSQAVDFIYDSLLNSTWSTYFNDTSDYMKFFTEKYETIVKDFPAKDYLNVRTDNFCIKTTGWLVFQKLAYSVEYKLFKYVVNLGAKFYCKQNFASVEEFNRINFEKRTTPSPQESFYSGRID